MNKRWRIKDIIDLEYFLQASGSGNADAVHEADRTIYLRHVEPGIREGRLSAADRSAVIRCWLEKRRRLRKKSPDGRSFLPGDAFAEAYTLLRIVFLAGGLLAGAGLALSFLTYRGVEPLNVSSYLGAFVFLQIMLVAVMAGAFFLRRGNRLFKGRSVLYALIAALLGKIIMRAGENALKTLSADQRNNLQAAVGLVKGKQRIYGTLALWPLAVIAQLFGIAFNLGVLGATLLRVLSADLAFGWQSTVQFSAQAVYQTVKIMALPWAWLVPSSIAHPTLAQIEGSRMVLKEGIYHLATPDLVSWWPFLCLAVLFYGLLPRAGFLMAAVFLENRALRNLNFDNAACDQLMFRLETPLLKTQSPVDEASATANTVRGESALQPEMATAAEPEAVREISEKSVIALIPAEIIPQCDDEVLRHFVRQTFGQNVWQTIGIELDAEEDQEILSQIGTWNWPDQRPQVLIILEAWQPPIKETLDFLKGVRRLLGAETAIGIGLIGKPEPKTVFTPVNELDRKVWTQALARLGDPGLRIEALGGVHGRQ